MLTIESGSVYRFTKPNINYKINYKNMSNYDYDEYEDEYAGTYAHDVEGYSDDDIDTIFDGEPEAYWNID